MPAPERVKIRPALVNVRTTIRYVLIGWNGTRAQGAVGIGPGAMGIQQGDVFTYKERIAGAVRYGGEVNLITGNIIAAGKHPVARIQPVARAGAFVLPVAPAPAIAGDSFVVRHGRGGVRTAGKLAQVGPVVGRIQTARIVRRAVEDFESD